MKDDTIKRKDAIGAINGWLKRNHLPEFGDGILYLVPSADIPQGEVDAVEIYERAEHNLDQGYITIGEFEERIEPLRHLCYGRPQGEWIEMYRNGFGNMIYMCSKCNFHATKSNFCPNCGARMI